VIESRERLVNDSKFDFARKIKWCHHSGRQKLDEISIGAREEIQVSGCYEELLQQSQMENPLSKAIWQ
jgi:hypothetical protein